jgi:hypothetical protein
VKNAPPGYVPEGTACNVLAAAAANAVPLYRLRDKRGLHFYTANLQERQAVLAAGYMDEGTAGFGFATASPGPAPLFRSYNPANGSHLYTMNIAEHDLAVNSGGMRGDGITGYLYAAPTASGTQPLYRSYNAALDDHFYTINLGEHQNAIQQLGYKDEGTTGWVLTAAAGASTQGAAVLHRLVGDFSGDFLIGSVGPKGLTSNSNYILNCIVGAGCNPIVGLSVTIDVTQPIILKSNSGSTKGFSFQLNAYSMNGYTCGYQQYVISLADSELSGVVNNYAVPGNPASILLWNSLVGMGGSTIPAGYKLTISLQTDNTSSVTGVTFLVVDGSGKTVGNKTQPLKDIQGFSALGAAPIAGFVMNFVGPGGGEQAILEPGGAGIFTYAASSILKASNQGPLCAENLNVFTVETANSVYGMMSASASLKLIQTFNTNGTTETIGFKGPFRLPLRPKH